MFLSKKSKLTTDALLGQAIGDAFGVPVEFLSRQEVRRINLRNMSGKDVSPIIASRWGTLIPKGSWSDDTSMTVASMASFIQNCGKIDYNNQMDQFVKWWKENAYCCLDYPFGLGGCISIALHHYRIGIPALECGCTGFLDNGNGSLMRILPFSLYCIFHGLDLNDTEEVISNASGITHAHAISRMSCFIWTEFLRQIILSSSITAAVHHVESLSYDRWFPKEALDALSFVTKGQIQAVTEKDIGETGYVVDTLYSAFFSLIHSTDFEHSILTAVNLGYDTDTAAAITGMAAGILYGAEQIPAQWMNDLRSKELLVKTAQEFAEVI